MIERSAKTADVYTIRHGLPEVKAEVIQVIKVNARRGCGVTFCTEPHDHEIVREVFQYFTLEGVFLAEHDTWPSGESIV